MNREEANELARSGKFEVMAKTGLSPKEVERLCQKLENVEYLLTDDFTTLLAAAIRQLMGVPTPAATKATTGLRAEEARTLLCALLLVPSDAPELTQDPDFTRMTEDEVRAYKAGHEEATSLSAAVSKAVQAKKGKLTYERFHEIMANAKDQNKEMAKEILLGARAGDDQIRLPDGEMLPTITPPPKTLASGKPHTIRIKILCVHDDADLAEVQILREVNQTEPAIKDLVSRKLNMTFSPRRPATRKWLVGSQLVGKSIQVTVGLVRSLRAADARLNVLSLQKLQVEKSLASEMRAEAEQLELDLIQTDDEPREPPDSAGDRAGKNA